MAIIGAGNLGLALADYPGFRDEGFEIAALFDSQREKIGQRSRGGVLIHDIRNFRRIVRQAKRIRIAVIAVPAPRRRRWSTRSSPPASRPILNFSPGAFKVPPDVKLKSMDLTVSLESLSFFLAQGEADAE